MIVSKAMDEQGLIARAPHARHPNVLELRLTDVGREALQAGRDLLTLDEGKLNEAIPTEDARVLTGLLERVIEATA